mgnify:CR=1 FL=1
MERSTLYNHIKLRLREAIEAGEYKPGDRIPSEHELMAKFGVSRATVRKAISELVLEGWLHRIQGRGTFVAQPKFRQTLSRLTSFTEDMRMLGLTPRTKLISLQIEGASREVAERLAIKLDDPVICIERLRFANDEPMALNISVLPYHFVPGLEGQDLERNSLYEILERHYGLILSRAEQTLEPTLAAPETASLLEVKTGTPLLLVEGVVYLKNDTPIEWLRIWYRGDRYKFHLTAMR